MEGARRRQGLKFFFAAWLVGAVGGAAGAFAPDALVTPLGLGQEALKGLVIAVLALILGGFVGLFGRKLLETFRSGSGVEHTDSDEDLSGPPGLFAFFLGFLALVLALVLGRPEAGEWFVGAGVLLGATLGAFFNHAGTVLLALLYLEGQAEDATLEPSGEGRDEIEELPEERVRQDAAGEEPTRRRR